MLLRAWANFSDCGFSRRVFLFRQKFSFSQSYRFFPSFCQALAEDRVTTPTKKKKKEGAECFCPKRSQTACLEFYPFFTHQSVTKSFSTVALKIMRHATLCLSVIMFLICVCWHILGMQKALWTGNTVSLVLDR